VGNETAMDMIEELGKQKRGKGGQKEGLSTTK
jgi:hypothetical protein